MPRNAQGVYSLPSGNPVVTGTTIDSTWANPTLSDIANEITASLPRNGVVGMTGPLILADDAIAALEAVTLQQMEEADEVVTDAFIAADEVVSAAFAAADSTLQGNIDLKAPLASPALTDTPTAPTAANATNNTQLATTAFVKNVLMANNVSDIGTNGISMHNSDSRLLVCYKAVGGTACNVSAGSLYRTDSISWTFPETFDYPPFVMMCIIPASNPAWYANISSSTSGSTGWALSISSQTISGYLIAVGYKA